MVPLVYNLKSLLARRTTTISAFLGIAVFIFVITLVQMLHAGVNQVVAHTGRADTVIFRSLGASSEMTSMMTEDMLPVLKGLPGIVPASVVEEFVIIKLFDKLGAPGGGSLQLRAMPPNGPALRPEFRLVEGRMPVPGTQEVLAGIRASSRFANLKVGDRFRIGKTGDMHVVGIFEAEGTAFESEVWGDLTVLRELFSRPGIFSTVRARLSATDNEAYATLRRALAASKLPLGVYRESEFNDSQATKPKQMIAALGGVIGGFVSLAAIIGTAIMISSTIERRGPEIAMLKKLGFTRWAIFVSFLFESLIVALAGTLAGIAACMLMGEVKLSILNINTWSQVVVGFHPTTQIVMLSVVLGVLTGIAGGVVPAMRAARRTHS